MPHLFAVHGLDLCVLPGWRSLGDRQPNPADVHTVLEVLLDGLPSTLPGSARMQQGEVLQGAVVLIPEAVPDDALQAPAAQQSHIGLLVGAACIC